MKRRTKDQLFEDARVAHLLLRGILAASRSAPDKPSGPINAERNAS